MKSGIVRAQMSVTFAFMTLFGGVDALLVDGSTIYAGGQFEGIGGDLRNSFAQV